MKKRNNWWNPNIHFAVLAYEWFVWHERKYIFQKKFDRFRFDKKMCWKGIWFYSFHGWKDFTDETFLKDEHHLMSSSAKMT